MAWLHWQPSDETMPESCSFSASTYSLPADARELYFSGSKL